MTAAIALLLLLAPVKVPGVLDLQNRKDPVSGKNVGEFFVDWKGIRVHFEDAKTTAAFRKEPVKFLGKLGLRWDKAIKGLSLENGKCPVTGKKVDREHFADKNGLRVYACCAKCKAKLWSDPGKTAKALGYAWIPGVIDLKNTTCPITGDQVYEEAPIWVDLDGIRIRVCCDRCVKKAKEDPARAFRLAGVDPKKLKEEFGK
jgi:YHS domain-containing protein